MLQPLYNWLYPEKSFWIQLNVKPDDRESRNSLLWTAFYVSLAIVILYFVVQKFRERNKDRLLFLKFRQIKLAEALIPILNDTLVEKFNNMMLYRENLQQLREKRISKRLNLAEGDHATEMKTEDDDSESDLRGK